MEAGRDHSGSGRGEGDWCFTGPEPRMKDRKGWIQSHLRTCIKSVPLFPNWRVCTLRIGKVCLASKKNLVTRYLAKGQQTECGQEAPRTSDWQMSNMPGLWAEITGAKGLPLMSSKRERQTNKKADLDVTALWGNLTGRRLQAPFQWRWRQAPRSPRRSSSQT